MPILSCYVDDKTHGYLKAASARLERSIEDLAEAAISEAAHQAEWNSRPRTGEVRPAPQPPAKLTRAQKHMLDLARAALSRLLAEREEMERDAARWRALMTLPRIRMFGSAGVDHKTGARNDGTYVHFGAEFWTDMGANYDRAKDSQNTREWGCHALTACADAMIERNADAKMEGRAASPEGKGPPTPSAPSPHAGRMMG